MYISIWSDIVVREMERGSTLPGACHWCNADAGYVVERTEGDTCRRFVDSACEVHASQWRAYLDKMGGAEGLNRQV